MTDLLLASVKRFTWEQMRPYAVSLERTGYAGRKVMFEDSITDEAKSELMSRGWELHNFRTPDTLYEHDFVIRDRFIPAVDFLSENRDFRYVLWTDVRDLIFQSDPSVWLADHDYELVGAQENWLIRDEHYVNGNAYEPSYPPGSFIWLQKEKTINGGALAGKAEAVTRVLAEVLALAQARPEEANDQSSLNYVLRIPPNKDGLIVPALDEGWTALVAGFHTDQFHGIDFDPALLTNEAPIFDKASGMVYTRTGIPFCIIHTYDRDPAWLAIMKDKYQ